MNELDINFNFDLGNFDLDIKLDDSNEFLNTRYCKPAYKKNNVVKYKKADELANNLTLLENERYFCMVDGSFVFGDFIMAFLVGRKMIAKKLTISTLSLSIENVMMLKVLLDDGYIQELNIIVSDFFYSHEKNKLIKEMYTHLDIDNKFQLAVCRSHMKITLIETEMNGGRKYIIDGSANLRSSDNIEQFRIEEDKLQYDFINQSFENILVNYSTIKKSLRGDKLFNTL